MRGRRRHAIAVLVPLLALTACASLLGYDDLGSRPPEPAPDATAEVVPEPDGSTEVAAEKIHPPPRPAGARVPSGKGRTIWLIIDRLHSGTRTAGGVKSSDAWRDWGYDLDGVCTGPAESAGNIDTCTRAPGAEPAANVDGNSCRDNAFGAHLAPLLDVAFAGFDDHEREGIRAGQVTLLLMLEDLDPGEDDPYVPGRLYKVAAWTGTDPPKFDGTDVREVDGSSVVDGVLSNAKTKFPGGYVKNNVWVSGEPAALQVDFPSSDVEVQVPLIGATMTLPLTPEHDNGGVGLIVGALELDRTESVLRPIAIMMGFCPGDVAYDSVVNTTKKYPDVVASAPSLHAPGKPCDAFSFALGFGVTPIQPVTTVRPPPPPLIPKSCGDAGTD